MKEHLDKVKFAASKTLTRMVIQSLDDARVQIEAQAMRFVGAKLPPIKEESPGIAERFMTNTHNYFDELTTLVVKDEEIEPDSYDNLSLVDHDYLEAMIAMEGMVKQLRDKEIKGMRSLLTRLETMFPNIRIDQTNNPLDPEQVGDCFNEAIKPLGFKAHYLLTIYREFNKTVFGKYEEIIEEANDVLIDLGVLPDLDITAEERAKRKAKREEARAQLAAEQKLKEEEEKAELEARMKRKPAAPKQAAAAPAAAPAAPVQTEQAQAEMFSMMQTLVQSIAQNNSGPALSATAGASVASGELAAEQEDLRKQQHKLMSMLTDIQSNLLSNRGSGLPGTSMNADKVAKSINDSLIAEQSSGELGAISAQSGDVINLVTMLYEAIWKDPALPVVMKELIGRTQISIMKVALSDTAFFDNENHPGRALLNELAHAGISWTQTVTLDEDPVYQKVKQLVERLLAETEPSNDFLQGLIDELRAARSQQLGTDLNLEKRVRESADVSQNIDDVNAYVKQKIYERVLKGYLDPSIRNLLDTHLHQFLVKLVVKEGPEGKSWKPVMSTIDVLLWTVQAEKQRGDRERFERINPRLIDNLSKALEIGGASKTKITKIMRQLKQVQEFTFHQAEAGVKPPSAAAPNTMEDKILLATANQKEVATLPRDDADLRRIDKLPSGAWVEFRGTAGQRVRCALASKIDSIDKLFFANSEGKKMIEITRMRLAHELKAGGVKIISEGSLVNRAMESVVTNLKSDTGSQNRRPARATA
ncbi:MAG: DUF1631 domain-containing protein [Pseudomonadales bacterium]|nr:DUF1631 domain-containing protein [Pseudomonadales bacterium]